MRKTLLFILLLLSEFVIAQSPGKNIVPEQVQGRGFHFVNSRTNTPLNDLFWDEAEPFVNGYARVLLNNKFSFVDVKGQPIHAVEFDAARNFSYKLAAVKKDNKWGFINESGKTIIPFKYDIVYDFTETVTTVSANNKWFLVNTNGIVIKPLSINLAHGFKNGIANIEKDGRKGTLDLRGEINLSMNKVTEPFSSVVPYIPSLAAATACPDNIDFEYGSFLNWKCFIGRVDSVGTTNVITVNPSAPINNRHTLYPRVMPSALDPYGLFPTNPPDGSNFAVRLGNTNIGAQAERVSYSIHVPTNDSNFAIKYDYAVVFEDPGHTAWTQPRFQVRLFDSALNAYVDCASFEYISTSNLPGFAHSPVDTSIMYKPWASVYVSMRGYAGKTMILEFTTADCVRRGHWGYAYLDVEKPCGQSIQVQYDCTSPNITTIDAPPGFQFYNWYDSTFTIWYGSGQHHVFNPGPPVNSTIYLEMIPWYDFGCKDTVPVKITGVFNANFSLSDTIGVCAPHSFTFYNSNVPSTSAIWDFGDGNTGTGDTVTHIYTLPGNYTVTLDVILPSGCIGHIDKIVSVLQPVGSFYFDGTYTCSSQQVTFDAVTNNADSLFWDFGDGIILATTQTTVTHTYALPGVYLPYLTVQSSFGCQNTVAGPDTIKIEKLRAGFFDAQVRSCASTTVTFTDTSYAYFGINSYAWNFGDGNTGTGAVVSHTYTVTGTYNIQLTITGISGCTQTITKPVFVQINDIPVAAIAGPLVQCQSTPAVFSSNITSTDAISYYHWSCTNGDSGSGNTFSTSFVSAGNYTIQLIAGTVNGCYDTTIHTIQIDPTPDVIQPADQALCNGASTSAVNFSGSIGSTSFSWTNDNTSIGLAATGNTDIASFVAVNNTTAPVTATITVSPTANSCPGPSKTFTITVNPTPAVAQPADQVLCKNDPTAAIVFNSNVSGSTFTWTNNNTLIGLAASGSGNIPSFTAINNTTQPVTATLTVRASASGCSGPAKVFTITVNPMPAVTQPADRIFCNGTTTSTIFFASAVTGATFSWTNDNPSIGLAASGSGNIAAFTTVNNGTTPVTATISVSATANGCPGPPQIFTITIDPTADVVQPADQALCNNGTTSAIAFTSVVSGATYTWTNDNPSIGLAANGSGNIAAFTAINNTILPVTANISVTSSANGCPGQTKTFTITVNPTANVAQPGDRSFCNGSMSAAINLIGTVSGTIYNWTNSNTAIGLPAAGTGDIPAFVTINTSNAPIVSIVTVTPIAAGCPGLNRAFTITVNPTPDVTQPNDQTLCNGGTTSAIVFTGSVNGTRYNWSNNNTTIGLAASGIDNINPFTVLNNSNTIVTATIKVTPVANTCPGAPKDFMIVVKPSANVAQPLNQSLCNGLTTGLISFTGTLAGSTFSWTNSNTSIGLAASGSGDIASFTAINNTTIPVTALINVTASANGCMGPAQALQITVHPTPSVVANNDMKVCLGRTAQLSATGASQYSWTPVNQLSCSNCANPVSTPVDTIRYVVKGTSAAGCFAYDTVNLNVIKPFQMLVDPGDTLCEGESIHLKAMQANSYLWSPPAGLNTTTIAEPTATPQSTTTYQVIGFDGHQCFTDTGYVTVIVGPKPTVDIGPDITTQTGAPVTLHPVFQNGPIVNWLWTPAENLSCTDCPAPVASVRDNVTYTVTVRNNYGCIATDRISINVFCKSAQVFIPNAFTPDGDGMNDILMVRGSGFTIKSFRIFSRWGELVFEKTNFNPNDPRFAWDGKVRGVPATPEVFVYTAEVICDNGIIYTYKGNTTVLK